MAVGGQPARTRQPAGGLVSCVDPALAIIDAFTAAMLEAFAPEGDCPPLGGGSTQVRFFAGDGALPDWNPTGRGCDQPFLWVRADRRYRSMIAEFPAAFVQDDRSCKQAAAVPVLAVEVGVGRCSSMEASPKWDKLAEEARVSLDDSWRIELVLGRIGCNLRTPSRAVATDTIAPIGPEGGIVAWTGMAYVQI